MSEGCRRTRCTRARPGPPICSSQLLQTRPGLPDRRMECRLSDRPEKHFDCSARRRGILLRVGVCVSSKQVRPPKQCVNPQPTARHNICKFDAMPRSRGRQRDNGPASCLPGQHQRQCCSIRGWECVCYRTHTGRGEASFHRVSVVKGSAEVTSLAQQANNTHHTSLR